MKRSRFSDEQIVGILKEHHVGMSAADQGVDDVGRVELAIDTDRQAFPGELPSRRRYACLPGQWSMMLSMRNFLPLWVRPSTKS